MCTSAQDRPEGAPSATALALKEVPPRIRALLAQREKLLRGIARRQAEVARLTERLRETATKFAGEVPRILQEVADLSKSIARMFEVIVSDPAWSKRERKEIKAVYRELVDSGIQFAHSSGGSPTSCTPTKCRTRARRPVEPRS